MVAYCENTTDCRRYLLLLHLGEKFDRKLCIAKKETTCDNCENLSSHQQKDISHEARELGKLVADLSSSSNVTMIYVTEVYKGSKSKRITECGHDKHPLHGQGASLDRSDIQSILKQLILKDILANFYTFNGEFPVVYIKKGSSFDTLTIDNGMSCISCIMRLLYYLYIF